MGLSVDGLDRITALLNAAPENIQQAVKDVLAKNANEFGTRLKAVVPDLTGELAATVKVTQEQFSATVSIGDADHKYAAPLEFGHMDHGQHVPPQPYFYPLKRVTNKRLKSRLRRVTRAAVRGDVMSAGDDGGDDA